MAIFRDSTPDSPMYREAPQSYSPHWARPFRPTDKPPPDDIARLMREDNIREQRRRSVPPSLHR
jgi:hypothetical protein